MIFIKYLTYDVKKDMNYDKHSNRNVYSGIRNNDLLYLIFK